MNTVQKTNTLKEFDQVTSLCFALFRQQIWENASTETKELTGKIFSRLSSIRNLENAGGRLVENAYISVLAFAVQALILISEENTQCGDSHTLQILYDKKISEAKNLMLNKNHDYDEAWRQMRTSSITDLMLMKVLRLNQIANNKGKTIISEGPEANYLDIINYCVFALIRIGAVE